MGLEKICAFSCGDPYNDEIHGTAENSGIQYTACLTTDVAWTLADTLQPKWICLIVLLYKTLINLRTISDMLTFLSSFQKASLLTESKASLRSTHATLSAWQTSCNGFWIKGIGQNNMENKTVTHNLQSAEEDE